MGWGRGSRVRITHEPTGHVVRMEEYNMGIIKMTAKCMAMLRGKLYAEKLSMGQRTQVVREYELDSLPEDDRGLAQMREFDAKYKPGV